MTIQKRRAPRGVESEKPVAVRFLPDEKDELVNLCRQEDRTMGSMVRIIYLKGLAEFKASQSMG